MRLDVTSYLLLFEVTLLLLHILMHRLLFRIVCRVVVVPELALL